MWTYLREVKRRMAEWTQEEEVTTIWQEGWRKYLNTPLKTTFKNSHRARDRETQFGGAFSSRLSSVRVFAMGMKTGMSPRVSSSLPEARHFTSRSPFYPDSSENPLTSGNAGNSFSFYARHTLITLIGKGNNTARTYLHSWSCSRAHNILWT